RGEAATIPAGRQSPAVRTRMSVPVEATTSAIDIDSPAFALPDVERGGIARGRLVGWVQRFEERHQRRHLGGIEVLSVRRHVSAALNRLADELIARHASRDAVQRRASLAARAANRMAIAALLDLKNQSALTFDRRSALEVLDRNRVAAPRVHDGTPWRR